MLPYLAQGANSSLEDGAVLGHLLGFMKHKARLPQILRLYESLRKSRGEAIVKETFKQVCVIYHVSPGILFCYWGVNKKRPAT